MTITPSAIAATGVLRRASRSLLDLLTGPHGIDRYVELVDPKLASDRQVSEVTAVHHETADVVTLALTPPRGWANGSLPRPRHGQAVTVIVEVDGVRHRRSFSVASLTPSRWTITVKANPTGTVSRHLVEHAAPGMLVEVGAPFGAMTLPADHGLSDGLLLVSGGSGITPVMAMLRELQRADRLAPVGSPRAEQPAVLPQIAFVHYARTPDELIFADELAALTDAYVNLDVRVIHTATHAATAAHGLRGHLEAAHLDGLRVDLATAATFVCGPAPLVEALVALAPAPERVTTELFHPPTVPISDVATTTGRITLAAAGTTLDGDGRSILEQAEDAGLRPEHGCRMGICHTCTRHVTAGSVRNVLNGDIATATDAAPVEAQICITTAHGDCTVDL